MAEIKEGLQSELRSFPAAKRMARLRPVFFASVVGLPMVGLASSGTYVAVQPDRYIANYDQGLQRASVGKFDEAVDYFSASVQNNPSYPPARFQLALAQLAIGNLADAGENFHQLAIKDEDVRSAAYVGYCFNKKGVPIAAIPWYERAIDKGADSASVYNNLGASYLDALLFFSGRSNFVAQNTI